MPQELELVALIQAHTNFADLDLITCLGDLKGNA